MTETKTSHTTTSSGISLRNKIAGLLTLLLALNGSFLAVLLGESIVYGQMQIPIIGGIFWPVSVVVAVPFVATAALFTAVVAIGIVNKIGTPWLFGYPEYGLLGVGSLVGTTLGVGASFSVYAIPANPIASNVPDGVGESLAVLMAVPLPFAYAPYRLYRPDVTSASVPDQEDQYADLDLEEVREMTVAQNPDVVTPVQRQRQRNANTKPQNHSTNTDNKNRDDERGSEPVPPGGDSPSP